MKDISYFSKIYLFIKPVDFRKQIAGLSTIASGQFNFNCFENRSIFIFVNKRKSAVKLMYWDATGFAIWMKKLEKDKFKWPKNKSREHMNLSSREIKFLLQGIDIDKLIPHKTINFSSAL